VGQHKVVQSFHCSSVFLQLDCLLLWLFNCPLWNHAKHRKQLNARFTVFIAGRDN